MSKKSLATSPAYVASIATASTACSVSDSGTYMLTGSAGSQAISVATPTGDGIQITFISTTTGQPVITFTGAKLRTGAGASATTATLAAQPGSSITVVSANTLWYLTASSGTIVYA